MVEAINDALHVELDRDGAVMVMGEDVGRSGGVFRATAGLQERFGADRCVDTPLAEAGILGTAIGLCMAGFRPVTEMQYDAFSYPCLDQLITHVGRYRWRTRGAVEFPVTIRMPYGGGVRAPELHDDSPVGLAFQQGPNIVDLGGFVPVDHRDGGAPAFVLRRRNTGPYRFQHSTGGPREAQHRDRAARDDGGQSQRQRPALALLQE